MYLEVCAGLCNRLRALVSGICAAEDLGETLHLSWPLEPSCNARFTDLFAFNMMGVTLTDEPFRGTKMCLSPEEWEVQKDSLEIRIRSYAQFYRKDRWLGHLRSLTPRQEFIEAANSLVTPGMIGVHIRRGDHIHCIKKSPTEAFIARMKEYPEYVRFFLATDDPKEFHRLKNIFGDRIVFAGSPFDRSSLAGMRSAILDFVCLSKCAAILGSSGSTFSETAAAYGEKILYKVEVEEPPPIASGS